MATISRPAAAAAALLLCLGGHRAAAAQAQQPTKSKTSASAPPSWHQFGSNVNYRMTAMLDVNGGAGRRPDFESFAEDGAVQLGDNDASSGSSKTKEGSTTTPGYSVPIEVITLQDPATKEWRQRVSYYSGTQVDYNVNGEGYKVIGTPYTGKDAKKAKTCLATGGSSTVEEQKVGYLNFFPTVDQMQNYTLGKLVTAEPGIPYRIASLEAPHGSHSATSETTQPDASYDAHPGMPANDWFQFHYRDALSCAGSADDTQGTAATPIKWTMLARNQIINAHTEHWVIRYLSYEPIETEDERKVWEGWFDAKFKGSCGDGEDGRRMSLVDEDEGGHTLQLNRLGMFFSTSSHHQSKGPTAKLAAPSSDAPSPFDMFLARHNKHYPHPNEYAKRREVHDRNVGNVERWNQEHVGKTKFAMNEFMDMEVKEVMAFRGGHIPRSKGKPGRQVKHDEEQKRHLRQSWSENEAEEPHVLLSEDEDEFAPHVVPPDFDPSTLPLSFDWLNHLPGSVGPIKDQGFCGSCWAFSFVSAMESHWYIANGQSVDLPEQFVNDCAWSDAVHACDGGESAYAAKQIVDRFGGNVPTRDAYGGYLSVDGGCYVDILQNMGMTNEDDVNLSSTTAPTESMVQLTDWAVVPSRDDVAAKHALFTKGPLAIALNVVDEAMYYSSGVLDVESCVKHDAQNLDHAINLVGWGVDELPDGTTGEHWILRNSWSDLWGDSGYFKVRMGDKDCGVTTSAGYPVVVSKPKAARHSMVDPLENVATS